MPPSGHSSSSHSSHSSSSHSSHSSSRSYSSSRSSSSFSSRSSSRGPSSHSSSSWSSKLKTGSSSRVSAPPARPRVNQPTGFRPAGGVARRPTYYYGRRHDYIYYPVSWVDDSTGTSYREGYYDEDGNRYDNVAFEKDGRYENVVCHCEYCGLDTVLDMTASDTEKTLQCPNCGAPMEIKSLLDEELAGAAPESEAYGGTSRPTRRQRGIGCLVAVVIILSVFLLVGIFSGRGSSSQTGYGSGSSYSGSAFDQSEILLVQTGDGAYRISENDAADKLLTWDSQFDSYYDEMTECWLWYNTDVEPPVWQYWFDGISSDYGDYGWMEHDDTGWYIEASAGNWIALPDRYDTGSLWYIDE